MHTFHNSHNHISTLIESLTGIRVVNTITSPIRVSVEERHIEPCPHTESLWNTHFSMRETTDRAEVERTIHFLWNKFS